MVNSIIKTMKRLVLLYDIKHGISEPPVYICTHFDTRNRYKNERHKIPFDQPQCPIFKDNRCCGGCKLSHTCNHIVNCNCFGFAYASMGGTEKRAYMTKASEYYKVGRIKNGKFDWDYYNKHKRKKEATQCTNLKQKTSD